MNAKVRRWKDISNIASYRPKQRKGPQSSGVYTTSQRCPKCDVTLQFSPAAEVVECPQCGLICSCADLSPRASSSQAPAAPAAAQSDDSSDDFEAQYIGQRTSGEDSASNTVVAAKVRRVGRHRKDSGNTTRRQCPKCDVTLRFSVSAEVVECPRCGHASRCSALLVRQQAPVETARKR